MKHKFLSFERYDQSPVWDIHRGYFKDVGIKAWVRGDIPYSGISNFTEAYKKARLLVSNLDVFQNNDSDDVSILEIGAGYGEFAKNFLYALEEICKVEGHNYFSRLKYYLSDFSQTTLDELKNSGRLNRFQDQITYVKFDALDKYCREPEISEQKFDMVLANYLLDQLPARVIAKEIKLGQSRYLEKYISIEDPEPYKAKQEQKRFWFSNNKWIKKLRKKIEFRPIDLAKEINLEHQEILETCFRQDKSSTVVYSYGSLLAVRNFLHLIKVNGIVVCSDFNASTKPGVDDFEPCYYGNSLAQAVNFEFIYKYFSQAGSLEEARKLEHKQDKLGHQIALVYEDPIKPLHTLILTRPDFEYALELGDIYKSVYHQNWFLRAFYKFMVEMQLSFYILVIFIVGFLVYWLLLGQPYT